MAMRYNDISIKGKLMVFGMVFLTIPLVTLSAISYLLTMREISASIHDSLVQQVSVQKDAVEKVFDVIKNEDGQGRLHTGNPDRAEGRLFLAFVAAILHVLLEKRMAAAGLTKLRSVAEALAMLRKVKRIHFESGHSRVLEIPKRTRKLLEAMKLPVPE